MTTYNKLVKKIKEVCPEEASDRIEITTDFPVKPHVLHKFEVNRDYHPPITLEHVLMVMKGSWFVDQRGCFVQAKRKEFSYDYVVVDNKNIRWTLGSPLSDQPPSLIEWLDGIIE